MINPFAQAKQASDRADRAISVGDEEEAIRERVKEFASLGDAGLMLRGGIRKPANKNPFSILAGPFEHYKRQIAIIENTADSSRQMWYRSSGNNGVGGTWYPAFGIADNVYIVKAETSRFLMQEYVAARRAAFAGNPRKFELYRVLDEAIRSGGYKYDAAFEWLNEAPKVIGPVQRLTPAEINQLARQLRAPLRLD